MPCRTDPPYDEVKRRYDVEAMLCAVFSVLDTTHQNGYNGLKDVLDRIDYKEAGITRTEIMHWWAEHLEKDRQRKAREAAEAQQKLIRAEALAKLSNEEKKALGLK